MSRSTHRLAVHALVLAALVSVAGAAPPPEPDTASVRPAADPATIREITTIIHDSTGWALTKDRARLESIIANDDDLFIFHPDSRSTVVGWDQFVPRFEIWMDPRFAATHFDVRDLRVNLSRSGDVAWFSAILDDCGTWEGREFCWQDTRWTGVLERRDGAWVLVQMHFSFASDREAGGEAPTADP